MEFDALPGPVMVDASVREGHVSDGSEDSKAPEGETSGTDPQTGSLDPAGKSACDTGF